MIDGELLRVFVKGVGLVIGAALYGLGVLLMVGACVCPFIAKKVED